MVFDPKTPVTSHLQERDRSGGVPGASAINDTARALRGGEAPRHALAGARCSRRDRRPRRGATSSGCHGESSRSRRPSAGAAMPHTRTSDPLQPRTPGMTGANLGVGATDIIFRGVSSTASPSALKISDSQAITAEWCDFLRNHEDMMMLWGGKDLILRLQPPGRVRRPRLRGRPRDRLGHGGQGRAGSASRRLHPGRRRRRWPDHRRQRHARRYRSGPRHPAERSRQDRQGDLHGRRRSPTAAST